MFDFSEFFFEIIKYVKTKYNIPSRPFFKESIKGSNKLIISLS